MARSNEATARIKINKLLEESGWRFEDSELGKANISLEHGIKFSELAQDLDDAVTRDGRRGAVDFLLLDKDGKPLVVIEAKREAIDPLSAKEQARDYARQNGARFIILSNGNIHYFWDTKHGNPDVISKFPTQDSITQYKQYTPNPIELAQTEVDENYIVSTQIPNFATDPAYQDESTRIDYLKKNKLKQLRPYQLQAIKALQQEASKGKQRFLFEMATGTGKTLVSGAIIKLFLKSGNARRILFLVDRLELEDQAQKAFTHQLGKDYRSVVYKEARDSWQNASIVISTIQTFLAGDKYKKEFSPTDFELVISDEAHRSIGGNSRAVFEYFVGYKLGLTATPKNYLKGFDDKNQDTQREYEQRILRDTYKTFGCEPGKPTFSYDLEKGSAENYLIKPTLIEIKTEITTQMLSDAGYAIRAVTETGETIDEIFTHKDYEKKVFNDETNIAMCKALLDNGLRDPIAKSLGTDLFGKTIVFAVNQKHAAKLTNILNQLAYEKWPEQYSQSDFATQISSNVANSQQMTINFANNCLSGKNRQIDGYETSQTRVAVTVGMMTTGYDCQDLLNIALMRPVFSPTDFVQIKGRGTRKYDFEYNDYQNDPIKITKNKFKFFDYFATCKYFEEDFQYDEKIPLLISPTKPNPIIEDNTRNQGDDYTNNTNYSNIVDLDTDDKVETLIETPEFLSKMDKEGFKKAVQEDVMNNETLKNLWQNGAREEAETFAKKEIFDKPKHFLNLDSIKKLFGIDRRITVKEFLQVAFGEKEAFEMKDELLESEWQKFMEINPVDQEHYATVKTFFKAYITDTRVRDIIKSRQTGRFHTESSFHFEEYQQLDNYKTLVPQYIEDYAYHLTNL
jgi:type I restriction enzyme R subunit